VVLSGGIYSLDRIDRPWVPVHDPAMALSPVSQGSKRPADNELYDRGSDLVEAATAIRRLADDPAVRPALPALLGCIEAALYELGCAAASMDETSRHAMPTEAMADRMHRGFMTLGLALTDAELASAAARGLAGRSLPPPRAAAALATRSPAGRARIRPRTARLVDRIRGSAAVIVAVARFPRRVLTRQATRLSVRLRRRRLDAALAGGADPWGAADLMLRASRLSSLPERQRIAAELEALVLIAEHDRAALPCSQPRPLSPCLRIRRGVVLEQRDGLLELAARLREPAPMSVPVVATLAWLARDEASPVFVGGNPPAGAAATVARCGSAVTRDSERL
jgi:hypothetical protein